MAQSPTQYPPLAEFRNDIAPGDRIIGIASSGLHSNGFSLVRRLVQKSGHEYTGPAPFAGDYENLGHALLTPTRIYVRSILKTINETHAVKALAHITGGGLTENIPRVLSEGLSASIDLGQIAMPPVMTWIGQQSSLGANEMLKTFNCGIGMVIICATEDSEATLSALSAGGEEAILLGEIISSAGAPEVAYKGVLAGIA